MHLHVIFILDIATGDRILVSSRALQGQKMKTLRPIHVASTTCTPLNTWENWKAEIFDTYKLTRERDLPK